MAKKSKPAAKPNAIGIIIVVIVVLALLFLAARPQLPAPGESVREEATFFGTPEAQTEPEPATEEAPVVTPSPTQEGEPELVVVSVNHIPSSPKAGESMTINVNIKNEGDASAATKANFFVNEVLIGTVDVKALLTNQAVAVSIAYTPAEAGNYIATVSVEPVPNEGFTNDNSGFTSFAATA